MKLLLLLGLVFICIVVAMSMFGGGDEGEEPLLATDVPVFEQPTVALPTATAVAQVVIPATSAPQIVATRTPVPTRSANTGDRWLVMLYQDADDQILEKDIYIDLNEAERIGSSDQVQIVAQIDRFSGGFSADGNWTSTKRFHVTRDSDLTAVKSQLVDDLGELNMADGNTLVDFVTWAVQTYPADKYALIMSDHGMGWPGGWSDPAPASRARTNAPIAQALGNQMYLSELDAALQAIQQRTGVDKLELVGMDACLMGHIEVLSALAPYARYAVVSQETEPALGWAYAGFLSELQKNPSMTGAELGKYIVSSYIQQDERIVDDQQRAELSRQGSPMGGLWGSMGAISAAEMARQMGRDITLAAVDLSAVPALVDHVNQLAFALQGATQNEVARARTYTQSFTSVFGQGTPPSYIDLGHFAQLLKQTRAGAAVNQAADGVLAALGQAVIAEKHGSGKAGATGVSIYYPTSQLYRSPLTGPQSYNTIAGRFANESLWEDFLTFHYTGKGFAAALAPATVPESSGTVSAPGTGAITLSSIKASSKVAAPGRPILFSTEISGNNVGHVLFFTGFYDSASNSVFVADMDYLESADTREVNGVYYPVWPEGGFTLEFEWEPLMFAVGDGTDYEVMLLNPVSYGVEPENATYTVDGIYTYANGAQRYARLYFRDEMLRQVYGFTGEGTSGSPREIQPETGDKFTSLDVWLDLDAQGKVVRRSYQQGGTLTFRDQMFSWMELDAAVGDYIVGFIVQDLDGNSYEAYTQVTVQ